MPRNDESFGDRFRKIPLWLWGLICMSAAGFSGFASKTIMGPPKDSAEAAGRAAGAGLFAVVGLVLIVLHFVLPKKGKAKTAARKKARRPER